MKPFLSLLLAVSGLLLAACNAGETEIALIPTPEVVESVPAAAEEWDGQVMLLDEQGAVTVEVIPLNLTNPGETLDFQVSMNTHSVDLSMNLAEVSALTTNTNLGVIGVSWDGPLGGHHVAGVLKFPATVDGKSLLDGATRLTLTIGNVDSVERTFTWKR